MILPSFGTPLTEVTSESIMPLQPSKFNSVKFGRSPWNIADTRLTLDPVKFKDTRFDTEKYFNTLTLTTCEVKRNGKWSPFMQVKFPFEPVSSNNQ